MAAPRKARGFTLVELLVVITIIGMLMALLLPAIQTAREAGRRNTCANNMRQVGLGLFSLEQTKKYYPGYVNLVGGKRASWIVPLLPLLERNDIYQVWQNPMSSFSSTYTLYTPLDVLSCPSNPADSLGDNPLSFVVNTGVANSANDNNPTMGSPTWPEDSNFGVFFNHYRFDNISSSLNPPLGPTGAKKTNSDFISTHDGTSYTLVVTENLQSTNWATDPLNMAGNVAFSSDFQVRQNAGFAWFITGNPENVTPPTSAQLDLYASEAIGVNDSLGAVTGGRALSFDKTMARTGGLAYSRPSSNHPGVVNAVFADNHLVTLNEDIDYKVYTQLMSPNHMQGILVQATSMNPAKTPLNQGWKYLLNEADY